MELTPPEEGGNGWEQDLSALEAQLEFSLDPSEPEHPGPPEEPSRTLSIVSIYHKTDRDLWFEVCRHLDLLRVPGYRLDFRIVPLTTNAEPEKRRITWLLAKNDLQHAHLVLLALSVDAITALLQHQEIDALLDCDDSPTVLPIALRPVFWQCPSTQLDPIPKEGAVILHANRDVAHVTIAKTVYWLLMKAKGDTDAE